jgi:hypothetical protein
MATPVNTFRPVNPFGQLVAKELRRLGVQVAIASRNNIARGSLYEWSSGAVFDPGKDQQGFALVTGSTTVPHIFTGTVELLDTSAPDAAPAYTEMTQCYIFPLPPTPDPQNADFGNYYILGRFAGQLLIAGVQMDLMAYC